jgi:hypothetical protein
MRRQPMSVLVFLLGVCALNGQSSEHQRVAVESESINGIELALDGAWIAEGLGWSANAAACMEYTFKKALSLRFAMPASAVKTADEGPESWSWRWEDPSASLSWLWRGEGHRFQAALSYFYPLDYQGRGDFHAWAASLSLARVRDPVILTATLDGRLSLPRASEGYFLWPPFTGSLELSALELLNDRVSYRVAISPGLDLGILRLGLDDTIVAHWSLALSLSVSWETRSWGFRAGWSGTAASGATAGAMNIHGAYRKEW